MADDDVQRDLQFGPFELSSRQRALRRNGAVLPLGGRALDILIYLAARPGEVIAKRELIDHVWSGVTVEEGSLRVHVAAIRKTNVAATANPLGQVIKFKKDGDLTTSQFYLFKINAGGKYIQVPNK